MQLKGLGEDVFESGGKHAPALACRFKEMGEVPTSTPVLSSLISPQTVGEIPVVVAGHVAWERRRGQEREKSELAGKPKLVCLMLRSLGARVL